MKVYFKLLKPITIGNDVYMENELLDIDELTELKELNDGQDLICEVVILENDQINLVRFEK